ncbi:MAG: DUF2304 domain-containing protein [Scrofimicrobium sp.]
MTSTSYAFGIAFALIVFAAIFWNLRAGRMKERYAFWWILIGITIVLISVFPGILTWLSNELGVEVPLNLGLFAGGLVLLLMTLQYSVDLSRAADRERRLVEELALLDQRVGELERKTND